MGTGTVEVIRGELVESRHRFAWSLAAAGEPPQTAGVRVFARSAAKPFQALPAVRAGVLERYGLGDAHLAVACASHGGRPEHLQRVREILAACGLTPASLGCGPFPPRAPGAEVALAAAGGAPEPIHHNCSGKHALGLALCVAEGWPTAGYLDAAHPLQRAMTAAVAAAAGVPPETVPHATDGCGMRTFVLPLGALAHAFGRLAGGGLGADGARVAAAMRAHPELVAFPGAIDTELMASAPGVVAKIGAEGVIGIGLSDGRGAAVKVLDGAIRGVAPAASAVVRGPLGLAAATPPLAELAAPPVVNSRGERVGWAEAHLD